MPEEYHAEGIAGAALHSITDFSRSFRWAFHFLLPGPPGATVPANFRLCRVPVHTCIFTRETSVETGLFGSQPASQPVAPDGEAVQRFEQFVEDQTSCTEDDPVLPMFGGADLYGFGGSSQQVPVNFVLEHLGDIYFRLNDTDRALEHWNAALKLDENNTILREKITRRSL